MFLKKWKETTISFPLFVTQSSSLPSSLFNPPPLLHYATTFSAILPRFYFNSVASFFSLLPVSMALRRSTSNTDSEMYCCFSDERKSDHLVFEIRICSDFRSTQSLLQIAVVFAIYPFQRFVNRFCRNDLKKKILWSKQWNEALLK